MPQLTSLTAAFSPYAFSLAVVSILGAKCFLLFHYVSYVGPIAFLVYLPTFFTQDVVFIAIARFLLRRASRLASLLLSFLGIWFAFVMFMASASEIGFYINTGSEVEWSATQTLAADPAAMSVLMSGKRPVLIAAFIMLIVAFPLRNILYNVIGNWLSAVWLLFLKFALSVTRRIRRALGKPTSEPADWNKEFEMGDDIHDSSANLLPTEQPKPTSPPPSAARRWAWPIGRTLLIAGLILLHIVRPPKPFNHMAKTLPVKMIDIFSGNGNLCKHQSQNGDDFPFKELIDKSLWHQPDGKYQGWAPGTDLRANGPFALKRPSWMPDPVPAGFERFYLGPQSLVTNQTDEEDPSCPANQIMYDPVTDPLKISNMQEQILEPLQKSLKENNATVSHVVLVMMESIRRDVFPIRANTHIHNMVLEPNEPEDRDEITKMLSVLTPVAEHVSGLPGNFNVTMDDNYTMPFTPNEPGMGGLNVAGAISPSTYSAKSILGSVCGVTSLVVDFLEEHKHDIYRPCLPHILRLFNEQKKNKKSTRGDAHVPLHDRDWYTIWMQAASHDWDHQEKLTHQMGFEDEFYKRDLQDPDAKHYPPKEKETNYFGFADGELEPYFKDLFADVKKKQQRLFLGHITASSHHPWKTPPSFNDSRYVPDGLLERHKVLNSYLNSVHYDDKWVGKILGMLEEAGMANETLVVMVGDHGLGFPDDTEIRGTFGGNHIGNFRVPLVFRHPKLPSIQIEANATSLSFVPTVLDLLVNTDSINEKDADIATDLVHQYEGQSLIRKYKTHDGKRQAWNLGVMNPGGQMLSLDSAHFPYRLVIPVGKEVQYRFTNNKNDPEESSPLESWSMSGLLSKVKSKEGEEAAKWMEEAEKIGLWWLKSNKGLWQYKGKK